MKFKVMDHTGDSQTTFDMSDASAVDAAMERFNELTGGKKMIAHVPSGDGSPGTLLREFDPDAEEIIFNPPLMGG